MKETRFTYEGVDEKRMYNRDLRERHDTQAVFHTFIIIIINYTL